MSYNLPISRNIEDNTLGQVLISVYKFSIMESTIHLVLRDDMAVYMKEFCDNISLNTLWDDAKKDLVFKVAKKDFPSLSDDKILEVWNKNPNMFMSGRLVSIINELESNSVIKSIIRDGKINKITE